MQCFVAVMSLMLFRGFEQWAICVAAASSLELTRGVFVVCVAKHWSKYRICIVWL